MAHASKPQPLRRKTNIISTKGHMYDISFTLDLSITKEQGGGM